MIRTPQTHDAVADEKTALRRLEDAVSDLRAASDVAGLGRVRTEALALADVNDGRMRRKAGRVAEKAAAAERELRRNGVEGPEEREARVTREARDAHWKEQEAKMKLSGRITTVLHLLFNDGNAAASLSVLRQLTTADGEGNVRVELPLVFDSWAPLLVDGYDKSHRIFSQIDDSALRARRGEIERLLKSIAVELLASGAELRGLTTDAVPLVAYALFTDRLPVPPETVGVEAAEKVDDLLLGIADDISGMSVGSRRLFIGLFRVSVLMGEAQGYAERLTLTSLSSR